MLRCILASRSSLRSQNIFNHTCRWVLVLFSEALLVFGCYSWFRMLRGILASRSSLRSQNYIESHLSLGVYLIFGCLACLCMLCLVSNAGTYPGFTELASLAKLYSITLVLGCLCCFGMLSLSLDAILGF